MPTLAECIKMHGADLDEAEILALEGKAQEYVKEGYEGSMANRSAIEDMLDLVDDERTSIDDQVAKAQPKPPVPSAELTPEEVQKYIDDPSQSTITDEQLDAIIGDEANEDDLIRTLLQEQGYQYDEDEVPAQIGPGDISPIFYSALEKGVAEFKQGVAPAGQWMGMIKKLPLKKEELEWVGLEDWLKEQKGKVTREEILDFVRANKVEVEEVTKGAPTQSTEAAFQRLVAGGFSEEDARAMAETEAAQRLEQANFVPAYTWDDAAEDLGLNPADRHLFFHEEIEQVDNHLEELLGGAHPVQVDNLPAGQASTQFSTYQVPGGENYRELLLTLPTERRTEIPEGWKIVPSDAPNFKLELVTPNGTAEVLGNTEEEIRKRYSDAIAGKGEDVYTGGHWQEPNVLAHVRFNERTGPNGEKVLFIEEIQSDWHQAGRKKGYGEGDPDVFKLNTLRHYVQTHPKSKELTQQFHDLWDELYEKYNVPSAVSLDEFFAQHLNPVPDAPFKTSWPLLSLKRMVRYAAENGFDSIAWTPGEVQAERYDLSKQIDNLYWEKSDDGTYVIVASKNDEVLLEKKGLSPEQLEEHVGKDIAEKIVNPHKRPMTVGELAKLSDDDADAIIEARKTGEIPMVPVDQDSLSGLDLKVGGEGMKGFYDKMLPAAANKFFGKAAWGKAKVGTTDLQVHSDKAELTFAERKEHEAAGTHPTQEVWNLPITPEMKQKALYEGMPAFQVGQTGKAVNKEAEEFSQDKIKHVDLREAVKSGLISEDLGAVIDGVMQVFPEAWRHHFEPRFSGQTFMPTGGQLKAHGIPASQQSGQAVQGVLLTEKIGDLQEEARHIAVMFAGSNIDTFLHEFGEFGFKRLLGSGSSADMKTVSREYEKAKAKFKNRKGKDPKTGKKILINKNKAFMAKNEWFSDGFRDWWLRQLNGESSLVSKELQGVFRKVLAAVKEVWKRLRAVGKKHPLDSLFDDIITNGRDLKEKYYFSSKEMVLRYVIGEEAGAKDLAKQGFAVNGKTKVSWDPGTICPKKRNLLEYVAKHLSDGKLGDIREIDAHDGIWEELLNPDFWIRMYDQALKDGVDLPCSYCYVEQSRNVAMDMWRRGRPITDVIAAKAKPVYETTPYRDAILKWTQEKIDGINARGGLRLFSFSDYVRDWHHDNVDLLLKHAKQRGLSVKAITKTTEFVEDFAGRGVTINVSIDDGVLGQNGGMAWDEAFRLKEQYPNVKVRTVALNLEEYKGYAELSWKGMTDFIDVITPYHHSDYNVARPDGASDFKFEVGPDGKLKGGNPDSQALVDWIEANPQYRGEERTCCLVGGKCFKEEHQKQCASNCGAYAGELSVPAQIGPKQQIRQSTGQARSDDERLARDDLRDAIKMAVRNSRIAYRQGKEEGATTAKATIRAAVAKAKDAQKTRNEASKVRRQIEKALKRTKVKKKDGNPQGKYGAEVQAVLDTLKVAAKLNQRDAVDRLYSNLELLMAYDEDINSQDENFSPDALVLENRLLDMVSTPLMGIDEETIERWKDLLADIEKFKEGGEMERLRVKGNRASRNAFIAQEVGAKMGGIPTGIRNVGEEAVTDDSLKDKIKKSLMAGGATNMMQGWKDVLDILSYHDTTSGPGESLISEFGDVLDQKNAEKEGNMLAMEEFQQMIYSSFGITTDHQMVKKLTQDSILHDLGTFEFADGEVAPLRMSRAQARKRVMELMDPTLHETFFSAEGMAWTDEVVIAIRDFLTPEDEVFIEKQLDWYQKYYESVNEVYAELYGVNLPKNTNYSPLSREGVNKDGESGLGEFIKEMPFRASATTAGGLKSRTSNLYPVKLRNDVEVFMSHVAEMEHFRAWAYKIRDLNAVFSNPKVRQAMRINFGDKIDKTVQNFIQAFARGGAETAQNIRGLDRVRSRYTRGVLAIKPTIFIKQLTSVVAFADSIPVKYFAKELPNTLLNIREAVDTLMQSTMMKHRWKSGEIERDIKTMMNSSEFAKLRNTTSFFNMLTLNVKLGDISAIIWGGYPVYKYHYEKNIAAGMAHEEANKRALRTFESIAESTQQSPDLSEQSSFQRGGSFAKFFTMFKSSPNQYIRKEMGAIRNMAAGRIDKKQFAKTMGIYHFILPMLFQWVSDRFTWDEEEQKRAMILGSLNGFFILGDALEFLIRKSLGLQEFGLGIPLWSPVEDLGKAINLVDWDELDSESLLRATRGLAGAVGAATGTPTKQVVDMGTGFSDVLSGDYEKGIAELAGWSPYVAEKAAEE